MKRFRINYSRNSGSKRDSTQPDDLPVFDQVEFDVKDGDETALLWLFSKFVAENSYEVLSISAIDEVPFPKSKRSTAHDVTTNAKWEKSRAEKYAERWFSDHGFDCYLVKQHISKTVYRVSKDGVEDRLELPRAVEKPKEFMQMYEKSFAMLQKLSGKNNENK